MFGIGIVRRSNLNNIGGDKVDALESSDDGSKLPGRPAASLRGASRRRDCLMLVRCCRYMSSIPTCGVQGINVERQIYWFRCTNTVTNFLDDSVHANGINLASLHNFEAAVSVVLIITWATQSCADASVDVGVIRKQALLRSVVEICTMVDTCNFAWGTSEDLWLPCV
jgi:hypothetical protein